MPRTARAIEAGLIYHVLNRGNGRMRLLHKPEDYAAFERVLAERLERYPVELLTYCAMPIHWHLAMRPRPPKNQKSVMSPFCLRLHPTKGFDYLGSEWQSEDEDRIQEQLSDRDREVEEILHDLLSRLETDGYESACEFARKSSPFQVIYLSRSQAESKRDLDTLLSLGLGRNELSDNLLEKRGSSLARISHYPG